MSPLDQACTLLADLLKDGPRNAAEILAAAELTPAQRAASIKRRKQIWEALHPEGGNTVPTLISDPDLREAYDLATTDHKGMLTAGILDGYVNAVMAEAMS